MSIREAILRRKLAILTVIALSFTGSALAQTKKSTTDWVTNGLYCIHHYEGAWNANTGNGYYGGLQMDYGFQYTYGREYLYRYGTANYWPIWTQLLVARRAYYGYRGYRARYWNPWPNTARACHLI